MLKKIVPLCAVLGVALFPPPFIQPRIAWAQPAPAPNPLLNLLFSEDAILQRDRPVPIWGQTAPGGGVTVKLDNQTVTAKADANGKWIATIGPQPAGGPHTLTVTSQTGEAVTRNNILFGDVWICSGQSNMEWTLAGALKAQETIAAAGDYPQLRLFTVYRNVGYEPGTSFRMPNVGWRVSSPQSAAGFSAVGYFFGRKLQQETKIPIGLINASWGGTYAEAWVSEPSLAAEMPELKGQIDQMHARAKVEEVPFVQRFDAWQAVNDSGAAAHWEAPDLDTTAWKPITLPKFYADSGIDELKSYQGVAWLRREVDIPAEEAGKELTLRLSVIGSGDKTYFNGTPVGVTGQTNVLRAYKVPGELVKAGRNVIAISVMTVGTRGGLGGNEIDLRIDAGRTRIPLAGEWKYALSTPIKDFKQAVPSEQPMPNQPSVLSNGMISPLEPLAVKGAIWYQGESNASRPEQYGKLLPILIKDWRTRFNTPLPFYIVQLSAFGDPSPTPGDDTWARLREAQKKTAETIPNSGYAVTIDIGNPKDIHPRNKEDVGLRLAYNALAKDYGQKVSFLGPTLKSSAVEGATMRLRFDNAEGGLTLKGELDKVFYIAGADQTWHYAKAEVQGDSIVLSTPEVTAPVAARYAWVNSPMGYIYNGAGLPASGFRTDDWAIGK